MSLALGSTIIARSGVSSNLRRIVESFTLSNPVDRIVLSNQCEASQNISLYIDKIHQDPSFYTLNTDGQTLVFAETVEAECFIVVEYWQTLPSGLTASDDEFINKSQLKAATPNQIFTYGIDLFTPDLSQAVDVIRESTDSYSTYTMPTNGFISFFFNSTTNNFYLMDNNERIVIGVCGKDYQKSLFSPLLKKGTILKFKTDSSETITFQMIPTIR